MTITLLSALLAVGGLCKRPTTTHTDVDVANHRRMIDANFSVSWNRQILIVFPIRPTINFHACTGNYLRVVALVYQGLSGIVDKFAQGCALIGVCVTKLLLPTNSAF